MEQNKILTISRIFAIVAVVAILGATLGAGSVLAAKGGIKGKPDGGNGGNGGNGGKETATMTVSPNPVATGVAITVTGSGFGAKKTVYVGLQGYFNMVPVTTDGNGSFSLTSPGLTLPGTYTYVAMVYSHKSWVIAASAQFEVT
ncbi:MAG: hypothetical protein V3S20_03380 [Dehalococcoidia bacterium]